MLGFPGSRGTKGDDGPRGFPGDKGEKGLRGIEGEKGEMGPKGDRGLLGETGPPGIEGLEGTKVRRQRVIKKLKYAAIFRISQHYVPSYRFRELKVQEVRLDPSALVVKKVQLGPKVWQVIREVREKRATKELRDAEAEEATRGLW